MHIHIKNTMEDNLSVYDSNNDDSVIIAILDDSIVTAIVLDLAHASAVKLHSELSKLLQGYQPPEIEVIHDNTTPSQSLPLTPIKVKPE